MTKMMSELHTWQRLDTMATFKTLLSKVFPKWEVGFQVLVSLPISIVFKVLPSLLSLPEFSRA